MANLQEMFKQGKLGAFKNLDAAKEHLFQSNPLYKDLPDATIAALLTAEEHKRQFISEAVQNNPETTVEQATAAYLKSIEPPKGYFETYKEMGQSAAKVADVYAQGGRPTGATPGEILKPMSEAAAQGSEKKDKDKIVSPEEFDRLVLERLAEMQQPQITKNDQGVEQITIPANDFERMIHRIYQVGMDNGVQSVQLPPELVQDPQRVYNHEFNQQLMAQNAPGPSPLQGQLTADGQRRIVQHQDLEAQAAQRDLQMLQQQYPTRSVDELSKLLRGF